MRLHWAWPKLVEKPAVDSKAHVLRGVSDLSWWVSKGMEGLELENSYSVRVKPVVWKSRTSRNQDDSPNIRSIH